MKVAIAVSIQILSPCETQAGELFQFRRTNIDCTLTVKVVAFISEGLSSLTQLQLLVELESFLMASVNHDIIELMKRSSVNQKDAITSNAVRILITN